MMEIDIRFDDAKAALVFQKHGVRLDCVKAEIMKGNYKIADVMNQKDHPGQKMFVVKIDDYAVCAPFVIDNEEGYIFLKTAFKARLFNK